MKLADYLLENPLYGYGRQVSALGAQTGPVLSPMEGLARALQGGVGGFFEGQGIRQAQQERTDDQKALASAMEKYATDPVGARQILASRPNLSDQASALMMQDAGLQKQMDLARFNQKLQTEQQAADMKLWGISPGGGTGGDYGAAIAGIESNGQPNGGYGAIGPVADAKGSRAYGKFQVMDYNIGPWTQEILGRAMTPQEFLDSPQAQNAVFKAKFGQYVQQTGNPQQAAAMWFSGKPNTADNTTRDVNGMTPAQYSQQFAQNLGQSGQPQQALNAPAGETINFQGIPLPKAAVASAMMITDTKERQKALSAIVQDAVKSQREGVELVDIRQPDGSIVKVPRAQAAGMTSAAQEPHPGTAEGDIGLLTRGSANTPEADAIRKTPGYAGAFSRYASTFKDGPNGQKIAPNTSMFLPPITPEAAPQSGAALPGGVTAVGQPTYNEAQSKAQQFVTQLNNAIPLLEREVTDGKGGYTTERLPGNWAQALSRNNYYPESMVRDNAKKYRQIANDIMTATLRQTSGATIRPEEFTAEAQKYIPQPGDSSDVISQKLNALKLFAVAMAGETGKDVGSYPALADYAKTTTPATAGPGRRYNPATGKVE